MDRREAILGSAGLLAAAALPAALPLSHAAERTQGARLLDKAEPFDYARLKGRARALAQSPYHPPAGRLPEALRGLDFDSYQAIQYRHPHALWADQDARFRVEFFHPGFLFPNPVHVYEVVGGQARQVAYDPGMFDFGKSGVRAATLPSDLGFAGLRIFFHTDLMRDVAAFLGASYFRAVGGEMQYGLSARGLAIDSGMARPEEFPSFTHFWLERPARDSSRLTMYALLDSPSITGAYRFDILPDATLVMDVDAALYPRSTIERLGVAPLTSMFYYAENDRRRGDDWRPEIHDSDGLSLWAGSGEWIWRPLVNPRTLRFNAYADENPHGFGLLQRDRNFDHYQDDGVFYERRPSAWVEPRASWGKGSVQLIELPAPDETVDNIVSFWNPASPPRPGEELLYSYRIYWGARMPASSPLARVVASRTGIGGVIGQKRAHFSWRFVVDFSGGNLAMLGKETKVEPVITVSRGTIEIPAARPLESVRGYRASFDVRPPDEGSVPIDIRLYLRARGQALTETWLYQWSPPEDRTLAP